MKQRAWIKWAMDVVIGSALLLPLLLWFAFIRQGKRFALRDKLRKADAIVVLAGTRGHLAYLEGKIRTAVRLYQQGWAPFLLCVGKFSVKVTTTPQLISRAELRTAVAAGRLEEKDLPAAERSWDTGLGALYMRDQAIQMGVPPEAVLAEAESLHTRENAEFVLCLLKEHGMRCIILVTSPFHQRRTYLTFAKVLHPHGIEIVNYYAATDEWHPLTWFLSAERRKLVKSEQERITRYHQKGDL